MSTLKLDTPREFRYSGLAYDEWMQELADEVARQIASHVPASSLDFDNMAPELLPFYAYDRHAVAWTSELGDLYARDSLKLARRLNEMAGTSNAWVILCQSMGAEGFHKTSDRTISNSDPDYPGQVVRSVVLTISPPLNIAADAILLNHLTTVAHQIIVPYFLELEKVEILNELEVTSHVFIAAHGFAYGEGEFTGV